MGQIIWQFNKENLIYTIPKYIKNTQKKNTQFPLVQQKIRPLRHIAQVTIWKDDLAVLDIHAQLHSLKKLFGTKYSRMDHVTFVEGSL